jgi:nucleoside-diphosphate-sugar epimerase
MKIDWKQLHGRAFVDVPCVVTGGAGFIGSHLVDALIDLGARVKVIDNLDSGSASNVNRGAAFVNASILDAGAMRTELSAAAVVFHQAAKVSVPASLLDPARYHEINVNGLLNVLEASRHAGVKRVMFAASSSAYGDSETLPKVESMTILCKSPYAANKAAGEHLVRAYANSFPLDAVSLRYFNIFGPRQAANSPYSGVIAKFASQLLQGQSPTITGDGTATRDFTFVFNAVHANLLAARHAERLNGEVFNVATSVRTSIRTLAESMSSLLDKPALTPTYLPARAGDVMHSQGDIARIRNVLGYDVIVPFGEGLNATVDWYKSR